MNKINLHKKLVSDISKIVKEKIGEIYNVEHRLNEMARIDDPHYDKIPKKTKVWIYGENDEQATKTPHFHVVGEDFEFEVYIRHIHKLDIWRTKFIDKRNNAGTWNERTDIRDAIIEWLDKPNIDFNPLTNAAVIVAQWNANNPDHKIPQSWKN